MATYKVTVETVGFDEQSTHTTRNYATIDTAEQGYRNAETVVRNLFYTGYNKYAHITLTVDGKVRSEGFYDAEVF